MTKTIANAVTGKILNRMSGSSGVNARLAALAEAGQNIASPLAAAQIRTQNVAADLAERGGVQYPALHVYCDKLVNSLTEKFRRFSGTARTTIEIRHSQDRLEGLQDALETYADAVAHSLDEARGDWGDGMYYAGGYEASFGAVKQGGRNFIQSAKITFEVGVSRS